MKTDALFYRLFQALPGLVFELAGLDDLSGWNYSFAFLFVENQLS